MITAIAGDSPRFHISPDGTPRICNPEKTGVCRYGADTPHFSTEEDARTAFEASQRGSFLPETLQKKLLESDDPIIISGVKINSSMWKVTDLSRLPTLCADGFLCVPHRTFYNGVEKIRVKIYKEAVIPSGKEWRDHESLEFDDFPKAYAWITNKAEKQAKVKIHSVNPLSTLEDGELNRHFENQKIRYSHIDDDGNLDCVKLAKNYFNSTNQLKKNSFENLRTVLSKVEAIKFAPKGEGYTVSFPGHPDVDNVDFMRNLENLGLVDMDSKKEKMFFSGLINNPNEATALMINIKKMNTEEK